LAVERPTILQIIPRLDTGGAELSTLEIAEAIVRGGGRALVASAGGRLESAIVQAGGEIVRLPADTKNPVTMLANGRALRRLAKAKGVHLLHARSRAPAWSTLYAARRAALPFVTTYHGAYAERGRLKRFYNSVMARSDVVIANSAFTADLIRARYATSRDRIRIIHRGIDPDVFDSAAVGDARMALLLDQWSISAGTRVILHPARLTVWKGQVTLIEAAAILRRRGLLDNAVVVLAGDAQGRRDYVHSLRTAIARHDLGDCVRLVGHVADMPAALRLAHVAVAASLEPEAFGRVAIEAQAMGAPVIATRLGAPSETVLAEPSVPEEAITGWLVAPGDAAVLAEALGSALSMPAHARSALGHRARLHVLDNFTLDAMKRQTLVVYDGLLGTAMARRFADAKGPRAQPAGAPGPA
jgi:glycosyltransferase involved in cell wall biosynthesis